MNKDNILEKAKKENLINDEAKNNKSKIGKQWGLAAANIIIFAIIIINYMNSKDISHLFAICGAYVGFEHMGKYFANKEKTDLLASLGGMLILVGSSVLWLANLWNF
ncbi:MAG: DUF6442 family protein [Tetragenococcus koreensis]|uniref:Uncharacterized protein n=1 Tax=Alkalibacterium gilvum TaxID=1130080 RepID=A0A1H6VCG8_9LACT|nr:DUF6442 family protein [Alkalibacterium gilvum]MDN6317974.1 DUF6442 family protein [Lactococcus lactis]MDN6736098.1 DUF6442 family protein [Tetragenococcus koreensis]SEJ02271.1 hypothetical protein SAMN04488113_1518 [Alkalibacterium gilvum]